MLNRPFSYCCFSRLQDSGRELAQLELAPELLLREPVLELLPQAGYRIHFAGPARAPAGLLQARCFPALLVESALERCHLSGALLAVRAQAQTGLIAELLALRMLAAPDLHFQAHEAQALWLQAAELRASAVGKAARAPG